MIVTSTVSPSVPFVSADLLLVKYNATPATASNTISTRVVLKFMELVLRGTGLQPVLLLTSKARVGNPCYVRVV